MCVCDGFCGISFVVVFWFVFSFLFVFVVVFGCELWLFVSLLFMRVCCFLLVVIVRVCVLCGNLGVCNCLEDFWEFIHFVYTLV